ncbi:MAG: peptidase domain-containing ABC transporter [Planctomycetales bacterium]
MLTAESGAELREQLRKNVVFSILDDQALDELTARLELVSFRMGEMIVHEGEPGDCAYFVYSGRCRVIKRGETGKPVTMGVVGPGNLLGEQALIKGEARSASVRSAEDCVLFRIASADFQAMLARHPAVREYLNRFLSQRGVVDFLRSATFIGSLPAGEMQKLLDQFEDLRFDTGAIIVRQGDPGDRMYLILSGQVQVTQESGGTTRTLATLAEGQYFGERALMKSEPRSATVTATAPTHCLSLNAENFDRLLASSPQLREQFTQRMEQYALSEEMQARFGIKAPQPESRRQLDFGPVGAPAAPVAADGALPADGWQDAGQPGFFRRFLQRLLGIFRRYPFVRQLDETDCGAASLAMISRFYGVRLSVGQLRELANVGREGASLYSLAQAAEKLGYTTRAVRTDYQNLMHVQFPAIAHWMGYHYIVVYEVRRDRVIVGDPAAGIITIDREAFEKGWTGRLLLLTPTPRLEEQEPGKTTFARFVPLLQPYRFLLLEILVASLILNFLQLASPIFTQTIVDKVLVHQSQKMLNLMLGGMLIIGVFQTLTTLLRQYLMLHVSQKLELRMSSDLFRKLMQLPMRFFHTRRIGDLLQRFQDNARLQKIMTAQAISTVLDVLMLFTSLALMLYYNLELTAVALVPIPAYILLTLVFTPLLKRNNQKEIEYAGRTESAVIESINSVSAIKACTAEQSAQWKHEDQIVKAANIRMHGMRLGMRFTAISSAIHIFSTTLLLWYGARLVISKELTIGQLMAFQSLIGMMTLPIMGLLAMWNQLQDALASLQRLSDLYDMRPECDAGKSAIRLPALRGNIKFDNVIFRYTPDGKNILSAINLEVHSGEKVALVGRSGSGKTTLVMLLQRFYDPSEGRILVDGFDLATVDVQSYRDQVGIVSQESMIFSGTIRENISLADPEASMEKIVSTAKLANAHDFIMALPLGYDTVVGEAGVRLSGGQKQRLCIARALLNDPRIIIFDEATSSLDTESEKVIQENMKSMLHRRTAFIIAHRLSTVQDADTIVVLDDGLIVEKGTHRELLDMKGLYYYLVSQQLTM